MKTQTMKIERESELRLMGSACGSHRVAGQALIMMLSLLQEREGKSGVQRGRERDTRLCFSVINDALYEADKHTHTKTLPLLFCTATLIHLKACL